MSGVPVEVPEDVVAAAARAMFLAETPPTSGQPNPAAEWDGGLLPAAVKIWTARALIAARVRAERDAHWRQRLADLQAEIAKIMEAHERRIARVRAEERQRILRGLRDAFPDWARAAWADHGRDHEFGDPPAVPVATPERHDAGCEQARGWGPCFCQRRADVDFSHTATGPVTTPLCEHGCTRAHRRRINPGEFLDCPGPVATPTGPGRQLRVMEAHRLEDCADPVTCWYEPHRSGRRVPVDQGLPFAAPDMYAGDPLDDLPRPTATPGGQP